MQERTTHSIAGGQDVQQLVPQGSGDIAMTPDREVLCVHRGDQPYEDMFDGKPYLIQPGFFMTQLGAAQHFKARAVVPGTRNPETRYEASFIAIVGAVELRGDGTFKVLKPVDPPAEWTRFTDAERAEYEGKQEALDREGMVNPIDADVTIVPTSRVRAGKGTKEVSRLKGGAAANAGGRRRGGGGPSAVVNNADEENSELMKPIPPEENQVLREAQEATRQAQREGHKVE